MTENSKAPNENALRSKDRRAAEVHLGNGSLRSRTAKQQATKGQLLKSERQSGEPLHCVGS